MVRGELGVFCRETDNGVFEGGFTTSGKVDSAASAGEEICCLVTESGFGTVR